MSPPFAPPVIFSPQRRIALRGRAGYRKPADPFLWQRIADELRDRLEIVSRDFKDALIVGPLAAWSATIMGDRSLSIHKAALHDSETEENAILIEGEDRLPFAANSYDLIITAGTLDSVNDLPGALLQMRRSLRPDGLFLATIFGAGTLSVLKSIMLAADQHRVQSHIHPQIELKLAADLLVRAGFTLPVADMDEVRIRYRDWQRLISDIRDMGVGNALAGSRAYLGRDFPARLDHAWQARADDEGRVTEHFNLLHLSGWAPSPDQPKPAMRGSGQVSLAAVIGKK
jgi:NADH dehydrogenase [ubiquinone] 1 alpha subcomplex assembly factor 5